MNTQKLLLLLLFFSLVLIGSVQNKITTKNIETYPDDCIYVSPNGSDTTGTGSLAQPFQSINYTLQLMSGNEYNETQYICLQSGVYNQDVDEYLLISFNVVIVGTPPVTLGSTHYVSYSNCSICGFSNVTFQQDLTVTGSYSNMTFSNCEIETLSGTTSFNQSSITLIDSKFQGEVSVLLIGFFYVNISSSTFDCKSNSVFGISVDSLFFNFINSTLTNCSSSASPLVIYSGNSIVSNSTFSFNVGAVYGGAVEVDSASGRISFNDVQFIQNSARQAGPAVYLSLSTSAKFNDCYFSCNTLMNGYTYYAPVYTEASETLPDINATNCYIDPACPVMCGTGWYFLETSLVCEMCSPGEYSDVDNATECSVCNPGTYSNTTASVTCEECQPGSSASLPGSTYCTECTPGTYSVSNGTSECLFCSAGYYSSSSGSTDCKACSAGTYSSDEGSSGCDDCGTIRTSDEGSDSCPDLDVGGIILVIVIVIGFVVGLGVFARWYYRKKHGGHSREGYTPFDPEDLRNPVSS